MKKEMKKRAVSLGVVVALALLASSTTFADTTWIGASGGELRTESNWNSGFPTGGSIGTITDANAKLLNNNGSGLNGYQMVFDGTSTFIDDASGVSSFIIQTGAVLISFQPAAGRSPSSTVLALQKKRYPVCLQRGGS